jgi:hypothetical protein
MAAARARTRDRSSRALPFGDQLVDLIRSPDQHVLHKLFDKGATRSALLLGDSQALLAQMPGAVFQTVVTSPSYWSLRDYRIPGQVGLESSLDDYITALVSIFTEVKRVLRDDGTVGARKTG